MGEVSFGEFLNNQLSHININNYTNELDLIEFIASVAIIHEFNKKWLEDLAEHATHYSSNEQSNELREKGNRVFKIKDKDNKNVLKAINYYTKAVICAKSDGESLALAHANRAQALLEFGYYQAAYDDCICALKNGYPERNKHKVLLRQANAAVKLQNHAALEAILNDIQNLELDEHNTQILQKLQKQLPLKEHNPCTEEVTEALEKIDIKNSKHGRILVAKEAISKNDLIFKEEAYNIVLKDDIQACAYCTKILHIPFPCKSCTVTFCSLNCQDLANKTHKYECAGYNMNLFQQIGLTHIALCALLKGLPEIKHLVSESTSTLNTWQEIMNLKSEMVNYARTLNLMSHFNELDSTNVIMYGLAANTSLEYLESHTSFLKDLNAYNNKINWKLLSGALILRHLLQFTINAHSCTSITPVVDEEYALLCCTLWYAPYHLRRGKLHKFTVYNVNSVANYPILSMANHACDPSLRSTFNGNKIRSYALQSIKANEEIFNCYTLNYKESTCALRQERLTEQHYFICTCKKCTRSEPDCDYECFQQYRCDACMEIFVPDLPTSSTNQQWYLSATDIELICTNCNKRQNLKWYTEYNRCLKNIHKSTERKNFYKFFEKLEYWLPGHNEFKTICVLTLLERCFSNLDANTLIGEFDMLFKITEKSLNNIEAKSSHIAFNYVSQMTYLWDLIALKNYKCTEAHKKHMLEACEILSDEFKQIFINYFNDYIK